MNNNTVTINTPVKKIVVLVFFLSIASILFGVVVATELFSMLSGNYPFDSIVLGPIVIFMFFSFYVVWLIFGKEEIRIDDKYLIEIKSNRIFSIKRKFELNKIKDIRINENRIEKSGFVEIYVSKIKEVRKAFPFWYNMSSIKFECNNRTISVLSGLNVREVNNTIELIRERCLQSKVKINL